MEPKKYSGSNYRVIKARKQGVYIGRPSIWGNPFPLKNKDDEIGRLSCVKEYRDYLLEKIRTGDVSMLEKLILKKNQNSGKPLELACHCAPKLCHGDVLAEMCDYYESKYMARQLSLF